MRGVAEVGAYKALREFKYENISDETAIDHICNIAGTSCGAINGLLITLGYTPEELTELAGKELFSNSTITITNLPFLGLYSSLIYLV